MRYTIDRFIYRTVRRFKRTQDRVHKLYQDSDCKTLEGYEHITGLDNNY